MFAFTYVWPYMGLGAALLLGLLLCTDALRSDLEVSRGRDLVWLAWAGTLAYLIHQFEEHGIDLQGATYAFRGEMCRNMGQPDAQSCPIPFSFVNAVNITCVWVFGPVTALLGRRWPGFALAFFSIPFVNTLIHLIPVVTQGAYNAGLLTAQGLTTFSQFALGTGPGSADLRISPSFLSTSSLSLIAQDGNASPALFSALRASSSDNLSLRADSMRRDATAAATSDA